MAEGSNRKKTRRRHDAKATRERILAAARDLFSGGGYGDVSVRQIAAAVELDAAMVIRHFGTKDKLYAEAMQRPDLMFARLDGVPHAQFGEHITRFILGLDEESRELHMLVALLRSASHRPAAGQLPAIADQATTMLAGWLDGENAELRAALICSELIGLLLMRRIFMNSALVAESELENIVARVAPMIQAWVDR